MLGIGAFKQRLPRAEDALPGREAALPLHNQHFVHGRPLRDAFPGLQQVQFGMGCFWGVERKFWSLPGVATTAVGYAGADFLNAAAARCGIKRNPFHPFSSFDTATLAGLAYGQTVLAKACQAAGIDFDGKEAHSARYDTEKTAELFCGIVNRWKEMGGWMDFDD